MLRAISYWVREHAHCPKTNLHIRINSGPVTVAVHVWFLCQTYLTKAGHIPMHSLQPWQALCEESVYFWGQCAGTNSGWTGWGWESRALAGLGWTGRGWTGWRRGHGCRQAGGGQVEPGARASRQGLDSRVDWFSIILRFSKSYTFMLIRYICKRSIPLHRRISQQSFHCQKIAGTLNMNMFSWKFAESFLIHKSTIAKKKIWN